MLDDAKFSSLRDRIEIARHWEREFQDVEKDIRLLGPADFRLYKAMQDWRNHVGEILAHVSDVLHPSGFEAIIGDDFAGLKRLLVGART